MDTLPTLPESAEHGKVRESKVLVINTGGTLAMTPNASGRLAPCPGFLQEVLGKMTELDKDEMPDVTVLEYNPLIDSSAMKPETWVRIATDIEKHYYDYDGFVVIMGTDTMAYAASAVSFLLENLGKTVVFTGAMIPFYEVYNDARRNLIVSMLFAAQGSFPEVCIFFHERLLRANRATKVNSFGLAAFDSPNHPPLATLAVNIKYNRELSLRQPLDRFRAHKTIESNILAIRIIPGLPDLSVIRTIDTAKDCRAIVLEIFGTGNMPDHTGDLMKCIASAQARGIVIVAASQCLHGCVMFGAYEAGRAFQEAGVISALDMTIEAVVTKLGYLFAKGLSPKEVSKKFMQNIRGELSSEHLYGTKLHMKSNL